MAKGPRFALEVSIDNCIPGIKLIFVLCSFHGVGTVVYNHPLVKETMSGIFKSTTNSDTQDQS